MPSLIHLRIRNRANRLLKLFLKGYTPARPGTTGREMGQRGERNGEPVTRLSSFEVKRSHACISKLRIEGGQRIDVSHLGRAAQHLRALPPRDPCYGERWSFLERVLPIRMCAIAIEFAAVDPL